MGQKSNDLVIVSSGALLPGADNPQDFFESLLAGVSQVHDLRLSKDLMFRPLYDLIYDSDRKSPDTSYSTMGADIPRARILALAEKHGLNLRTSVVLHVMVIEAVHQCLGQWLDSKKRARTDFIFGVGDALAGTCGNCSIDALEEVIETFKDSEHREALQQAYMKERRRFAPIQDRPSPAELSIPSHLGEQVRRHFSLGGETFLVDAACASSLAALYMAKLRLQQGLCDYAIVGGADDCLGSGNMLVGFSKLGVLSASGPLPFDERSDGTVIGEGAVAFLVTTLATAKRDGLPILGVIKGVGGSSDGKSGGLTEPIVSGQLACYKNAYDDQTPAIDYIECHGTGTMVGDNVEISSLTQFFGGRAIPIGSAKYNMGHTMVAAGAVSLLKSLGILARKTVPPSPYFQKFPASVKTSLFLNKTALALQSKTPLNIGVSSFGFGGTNFHVWLQEYREEDTITEIAKPPSRSKVLLCGTTEATLEQVPELFSSTGYNLPPKTWPFIDRAQLLSVLLAEKLFRDCGVHAGDLDQNQVHVISGTAQPLKLEFEMMRQGVHKYVYRYLSREMPFMEKEFRQVYDRVCQESIEINEQSAIGSINSLIASRVSKAFDFHGLNLTIDGDQSAGLKAVETARTLLAESSGAVIVFESLKQLEEKSKYLRTTGMRCYLLATPDFAKACDLPVLGELGPLSTDRSAHA